MLKTPHHNSRPRILPVHPKLHLLPAHIPPLPLPVTRKAHPTPLPLSCLPPPAPTAAPTLEQSTTPGPSIQTRQPNRPPNQHAHKPPPDRPPPSLRLAPHPPFLPLDPPAAAEILQGARSLPSRHRPDPMPRLHPLPSARECRASHRPPHPACLPHNVPL